MVRRAPLLLAAAVLALAGCKTAGPRYRLPAEALVNAPSAQGRFAGAGERAVSEAPVPEGWWRLYEDSTLDRLVTQAFAANTDLRVAEANLERSRALLAEARTARQPQLNLDLNPSYAVVSGEAFLQPNAIPAMWLYDVGFNASYQVDLFGRIHRAIQAASAEDEAVEAARDLTRVTVAANVADAYADVCGAGGELVAARRSVALQQRSLALTQRLLRAGRGVSLDVTRSQGLIAQVEADIPALLARQRNALYRLATLTGRPPAEFDASLTACTAPPRLTRPIPVGDGAALLRRRPDVREAERRLAAATAEIGVRTAELYPEISLGGTLGSTGAASDLFTPPTNRYSLGPNLTWRLNPNPARARVAQAEAARKADLARFDGVVLAALRDVESALELYARDLDREQSLRLARDRAAQAAADARRLQLAGRTGALSVLDAERSLASTEQVVAGARSRISADQVALFLALGGGWQPGATEAAAPAG